MFKHKKLLLVSLFSFCLGIVAHIGYYHLFNEPEVKIVEKAVLSLDGKLASPDAKTAVSVETKQISKKEIAYVEKEADEKTDVELNSAKKVVVKVNGNEHEIKPTVEENSKFENGKLVVNEVSKTEIEIKAPKPAKWTATYLYNPTHKKQGVGVGYALSNSVRVDAYVVDGEPYIGATFAIGSLNAR